MAVGFTRDRARKILTDNIEKETYVCLSTTTPNEDGSNFTEPSTSAGYIRQRFGNVDSSKSAQIANADYIFIFEAWADCGSVTHVGLSDSAKPESPVFLMGELTNAITIGAGYVPLIRPYKLKVGLDKDALETYPNEKFL